MFHCMLGKMMVPTGGPSDSGDKKVAAAFAKASEKMKDREKVPWHMVSPSLSFTATCDDPNSIVD